MSLGQQVIVYDKRGQKGVVYDTAYSEREVENAIRRCRARHNCNVRAVLAKSYPPA